MINIVVKCSFSANFFQVQNQNFNLKFNIKNVFFTYWRYLPNLTLHRVFIQIKILSKILPWISIPELHFTYGTWTPTKFRLDPELLQKLLCLQTGHPDSQIQTERIFRCFFLYLVHKYDIDVHQKETFLLLQYFLYMLRMWRESKKSFSKYRWYV